MGVNSVSSVPKTSAVFVVRLQFVLSRESDAFLSHLEAPFPRNIISDRRYLSLIAKSNSSQTNLQLEHSNQGKVSNPSIELRVSQVSPFRFHQSQNIVFLPKRFDLAVDVDGAPGSTRDFCALDSQYKSVFIPCNFAMQKRLPRASEVRKF